MAKSKKSKKGASKKSKSVYADSGLAKKVGRNATPSTAHLVGHDCVLTKRNGILVGEQMVITLTHADDHGCTYERDWRGKVVTGAMPWSAVDSIERKILQGGKGEQFDKIPWDTSDVPGYAASHVGEDVSIEFAASAVTTSPNKPVRLGTVDGVGFGYLYASYGSEKVAFRPTANVIGVTFAEVTEDDDEE